MPTFPSWTDTRKITGPAVLTGPDDIFNEAAEPRPFARWLMNGTPAPERLQGGAYVQDFVMKDDGGTAANRLPGSTRSAPDPQVLAELNSYWRLTEDVMVVNKIKRALNEGGGSLQARYHKKKSDDRVAEIRFATSMSNKIEADLFAFPNATTMQGEGALAINPSPIWEFVNEYDALPGTYRDSADPMYPEGTGLPQGYTTIQGVDPTTEKWFRCWQVDYDDSSITTSTASPGAAGLIKALTIATQLMKFTPLIRGDGATVSDAMYDPSYAIPYSINGAALIQKIMQTSQNYFRVSAQDPFYPNPSFAGIPFVGSSLMDTAAVFPTATAGGGEHTAPTTTGATEMAADKQGPRFPIISKKMLRWYFHSDFYFHMWEKQTPYDVPDTDITYVSTLHNRFCRSRRRMAMVYPKSNITI